MKGFSSFFSGAEVSRDTVACRARMENTDGPKLALRDRPDKTDRPLSQLPPDEYAFALGSDLLPDPQTSNNKSQTD